MAKSRTEADISEAEKMPFEITPFVTRKLQAEDWVAAKARARQFSRELTPRQRDIVQLFGEGRAIKQIADVLNLSEKTVEFHKHHIMQALNLNNNAELILFALKEGLISVDAEFQEEKEEQLLVADKFSTN
jgi:DNA-binding NarL/FixJ family response regulator